MPCLMRRLPSVAAKSPIAGIKCSVCASQSFEYTLSRYRVPDPPFGIDATIFSIGQIQDITANGIGFQAADSETSHKYRFTKNSLFHPCVNPASNLTRAVMPPRDDDDLVLGLRLRLRLRRGGSWKRDTVAAAQHLCCRFCTTPVSDTCMHRAARLG